MRVVARIIVLALIAAAGWYVALLAIPGHASDQLFAKMLAGEAQLNLLRASRVRTAPGDIVPLDNADTVTRSTIYDLSEGPLLFEADVPTDLEYWSVSIFARNTDTIYVANDQKVGTGRFRLTVRLGDQRPVPGVAADVISPSTRGFLLVRAVMKDRSDPADGRRTLAAVERERAAVVPANR